MAGPALVGGGMAGEHEDARADDAADTEREEAPHRKRALQGHTAMGYQSLDLGLLGFGLERGHRLSGKDIRHVSRPFLPSSRQNLTPSRQVGAGKICRRSGNPRRVTANLIPITGLAFGPTHSLSML